MSGKQIRNRVFIGLGLLLAAGLTVLAVVGYVYRESPEKAVPEAFNKQAASKAYDVPDNLPAAAVTDEPPLSQRIQNARAAQQSIVEEEKKGAGNAGEKERGPLYASVSKRIDSEILPPRPQRTGSGLRNPMLWPSRNVIPPALPKDRKRASGVSGVSTPMTSQPVSDLSSREEIPDNSSAPEENTNAGNNPDVTPDPTDNGNTNPDINPDNPVEGGDNYSVSVSRSINAGRVVLTVAVASSPPNGLIIHENIPAGWQMTSASPAPLNCWRFPCSGTMKWLFITDNVGTDISYTIEKTGDTAASAISGNYLFKDPAAGHLSMTTKGANGV